MSLRFGVLTVSDRAAYGEREDLSGPALVEAVKNHGWEVNQANVVEDDLQAIQSAIKAWADALELDVILTTGGTGLASRDVTPEATLAILDRQAMGIAEAIRNFSLSITPHAMLSRGVAGVRGKSLIINLPGSPKGAVEGFEVVAPVLDHAAKLIKDDPEAEDGH